MVTACATTRLQLAVSPTGVSPRASRRRAFRPWCRWSTTVSASPCCLRLRLMPACFWAQTSSPDHCSTMTRYERLVWCGAAAPGAATSFACSQKSSWNALSSNRNLPRSHNERRQTRTASAAKPAVGLGHCLTMATTRIRPPARAMWRRWRTDEIVIGLPDQCERNYSLDRSRSGLYYARTVEPSTRWVNSDAQEQLVCHRRRFDRDWLRTMGGLDHQRADSPFDRSWD